MKKTIHYTGFRYVMLPAMAAMVATGVLASDTPPANDWAVAGVIGAASKITVTSGGAAVTVAFAASSQDAPPPALRSDLLVGGSSPAGTFRGDLASAGYSGIRFRINGIGVTPKEASVLIRKVVAVEPEVRYRTWVYKNVSVSAKPGEWTIVDVPLSRSAGWTTSARGDAATLDAYWAADMTDVEAMFVRIQSSGWLAQAYSVSDFRLLGEGIVSAPANLSPLKHYFGVDSLENLTAEAFAAMIASDRDGDGMSDYNEILAGFDPNSAASVFTARVAVGAGKNTISWDGVLGKKYAVWRSNDLTGAFVAIAVDIACKATGVMTHDDNSPVPGKANFYKVVNY